MLSEKTNSIAGMSLGGGKKENFFFCLLEFFKKDNRWFLTSLNQVKEESHLTQDEAITNWVESSSLKQLIVDFPLSKPPCETCDLVCPGIDLCHHPVVNNIQKRINSILNEDLKHIKENPKKYEQERRDDSLVHYGRSVLDKDTCEHILSKSFKRKLKKGFVPYWNRPIDFWIWLNYYDQMLKTFNISYDSFGNVSVMLLHKFHYLLRHLPRDLQIYESNTYIALIELYRANIITKKHLIELQDMNVCTLARVRVAKAIEKKLNIFIYSKDLELISKHPKAFDSFVLAVVGKSLILDRTKKVPELGVKDDSRFIIPSYLEDNESLERP
ncbi:MAG: hypothetical protein QF441_13580 [Bacteriovoracaceae bacterium]|jgi:hypothetical protein|nr:hypothetical protein [Bacteriovoracaceae bacterium]